ATSAAGAPARCPRTAPIERSACTHGQNGGAPASSRQGPQCTAWPRRVASRPSSSARRVLPMPASPRISSRKPLPASAAESSVATSSSSLARPTKAPGERPVSVIRRDAVFSADVPKRRVAHGQIRLDGSQRGGRAVVGSSKCPTTARALSSGTPSTPWATSLGADLIYGAAELEVEGAGAAVEQRMLTHRRGDVHREGATAGVGECERAASRAPGVLEIARRREWIEEGLAVGDADERRRGGAERIGSRLDRRGQAGTLDDDGVTDVAQDQPALSGSDGPNESAETVDGAERNDLADCL